LVSVAEAGFVILSEAKDLEMAQILRFAQNDIGRLPIFRNKDELSTSSGERAAACLFSCRGRACVASAVSTPVLGYVSRNSRGSTPT
jgi:hypothetical protein